VGLKPKRRLVQVGVLGFFNLGDALRLGFLYSGTFTRGFLRTVVLVVGTVTLAGTLWIEVLIG
jgi:hypothetical protein